VSTETSTLTPEQIAAHYDDSQWWTAHYGHAEWAVHIIGPDDVHTRANPDLDDDDPANPEFTQRTALKFAADTNAFVAGNFTPDDPTVHAVVLHCGEPWTPDAVHGGPDGAYCEFFDFGACEWFCNLCFRVLGDDATHCPTCAPASFPGLQRLECVAEPTHPALFMYADNLDGYGSPSCFYCTGSARDAWESEREHAGHRAWRRWPATDRALRWLGHLPGLTVHRSTVYTADCRGCITSITWRWSR